MARRSFVTAIALAASTAAVSAIVACSGTPDPTRTTVIFAPDFAQFSGSGAQLGVSAFLERRCGTLDCHGQVGRPLRIFGQRGLRLVDDAGNIPGLAGTTPAEQYANYQAAISVEPETMSLVVADPENNPPEKLLLVKKPLLLEGHKGGQIIASHDDGYTCLVTWLANKTDFNACTRAATEFDTK